MKWITVVILLCVAIVLSSCLAAPVEITNCVTTKPADFILGLWHGFIAPVTFVISVFTDQVEMYAVNNIGGWYDFGFVLGAGILFGGSSKVKRKRK